MNKDNVDRKYLNSMECIKYYKVCCSRQCANYLFNDYYDVGDDDGEVGEQFNTADADDEDDTNGSAGNGGVNYWESNKKCEYGQNTHWIMFALKNNLCLKKIFIKFNQQKIKDDLNLNYVLDLYYGTCLCLYA